MIHANLFDSVELNEMIDFILWTMHLLESNDERKSRENEIKINERHVRMEMKSNFFHSVLTNEHVVTNGFFPDVIKID